MSCEILMFMTPWLLVQPQELQFTACVFRLPGPVIAASVSSISETVDFNQRDQIALQDLDITKQNATRPGRLVLCSRN